MLGKVFPYAKRLSAICQALQLELCCSLSHLLRPFFSFLMLQLQLPLQFQFPVAEWQTTTTTICNNLWKLCSQARRKQNRVESSPTGAEVDWFWAVVIAAVTVWLRNWRQVNNCEAVQMCTVINQTNLRISQRRKELQLFNPHRLTVKGHPRCDTCCRRGQKILLHLSPKLQQLCLINPYSLQRVFHNTRKIKVHGINFYDKLIKHKFRTLRARDRVELDCVWRKNMTTLRAFSRHFKIWAMRLAQIPLQVPLRVPVPVPITCHTHVRLLFTRHSFSSIVLFPQLAELVAKRLCIFVIEAVLILHWETFFLNLLGVPISIAWVALCWALLPSRLAASAAVIHQKCLFFWSSGFTCVCGTEVANMFT